MKNILKKLIGKLDKEGDAVSKTFLSPEYQQHNVARLAHLDSLELPMRGKRVFEFGAGVGDHSYYFLTRGCEVTVSDSRPELLKLIEHRFGLPTILLDLEKDLSKIRSLPYHDIFYCYGVLYHISNPKEFLLSLSGKCGIFLLETCVSHDFRESGPYLVSEDVKNPTQASSGTGCRPTRAWIFSILKQVFPYVYIPVTQPNHEQFPADWSEPMEDRTRLIRAIFIGSTTPIDDLRLTTDLIKVYHK